MTALTPRDLPRVEREMAISCARSDIESFCAHASLEWIDTADCDPDMAPEIARAVWYLETLGLLDRHPTQPALVCVVRAEADAAPATAPTP